MNIASKNQRKTAHVTASVVLPVFNELHALDQLHDQITAALENDVDQLELIFVNDGSRDGSAEKLEQLAAADHRVRVLHLSRNFGHQAAVQAGLNSARGDVIFLMDSDLQDSPAALPKFLQRWRAGDDIVYAVRTDRKEVSWKRFLFTSFYRVLNAISTVKFPLDAGNFCLLDRQVLNCLNELPERDRYFPGLRSWVGFQQSGIPVERNARYDDTPRVSLWGLFRLAKTAIFSFSRVPLSLFYAIGLISLCISGLAGLVGAWQAIFVVGSHPLAWGMVSAVSLFGGINALGIAILGEYVLRIYDQVRARPNYLVAGQTAVAREDQFPQSSRDWPELADSESHLLTWIEQELQQPVNRALSHQD